MARQVFYSFHYKPDNWRASQIRNIGVVEGNRPASDNDWEEVTRGGDEAIKKWIATQLQGRSCSIILIGSETAGRKWINYEIGEAWKNGLGILGIHIHNIKNSDGKQCSKGTNPFSGLKLGEKSFDTVVKTYDPPHSESTQVYQYIEKNLAEWIEEAIKIRKSQ
ncbi:MAG: TIR domain-containing protein [Bdellovibrionales bacterium]|nr:TIR domain-containing protein [Bdellovibrionales bacterium]